MKIPIWNNLDEIDRYMIRTLTAAILMIVLVFAICGTSISAVIVTQNYIQCSQFMNMDTDHDYKFLLVGGCMVRSPQGYYVHIDDSRLLTGELDIGE